MDGDLTTLATLKAFLAITSTANDAELARLITAASAYVRSELAGAPVLEETYVRERYHGPGGYTLVLRHRPVLQVAEVRVDGRAIPLVTDARCDGALFDAAAVYLRGYTFCRGVQNVEVTYSAGYEDVPGDLEQATVEIAALIHKERDRFGIQSKTLAGEVITYLAKATSPRTLAILANYRNEVPA